MILNKNKNYLQGVILPKQNGKIPVVICEFKHNEIISKNMMTSYLTLEKIVQEFPDKKSFLTYLKDTNQTMTYNECWQNAALEKMTRIKNNSDNKEVGLRCE